MFASCYPLEKEFHTEVRERLNIFSNQILGYLLGSLRNSSY